MLFIHPQAISELAKRLKGNGWLTNTIGLPTETTIALSHLIFEGTLDRYPGLKVMSAHGGGFLPSYADRSDHACFVNPSGCDPNITLKKKPTEYLKQLYFDSLIFSPEALRHLAAQVGTSQIMLGSDHPYPWQDRPVDHIMATTSSAMRRRSRSSAATRRACSTLRRSPGSAPPRQSLRVGGAAAPSTSAKRPAARRPRNPALRSRLRT